MPKMSATVCNAVMVFLLTVVAFVIAVVQGCDACYPCVHGEDSCTEVNGMTLEYAVANGTSARIYGLYITLLAVLFYVYCSPVLAAKYGLVVMHAVMRICIVVGCFVYFIAPPHLEPGHQACATTKLKVWPGTHWCADINPISQYVHSTAQACAVVCFWVIWLLSMAIVTGQNMCFLVLNCVHAARRVGWCVAAPEKGLILCIIIRVICTMNATGFTIVAALKNEENMSTRGPFIFYGEVLSHGCILLFILTTFYEMAAAPEKDAADRSQDEGNATVVMPPTDTDDK